MILRNFSICKLGTTNSRGWMSGGIAQDMNFGGRQRKARHRHRGGHNPLHCLSQLRAGDCGRVVAVEGEPHLAIRILELGLVSGTSFRVLRTAPLGGPMEVEIEGSLLSLRRSEADAVHIEI